MKKCLACSAVFPSPDSCCLVCGTGPEMQEGFLAYAPALAQGGGGFKAAYFAELARLEAGHFWFRARNRLIIWALGKYCSKFSSFLEIGCGTGYVLSGIANAFPDAQLHGSEIFTAGLVFAAARQPTIDFMQMDGRYIPFVDEFDSIGAFDVLEHIEEDEQVLGQMHSALKLGGVMLLTVPQHAWLWSPVDDYACHMRRYSAKEIHAKVEDAGFKILRSTSFVSSLLPALFTSRLVQKLSTKKNVDPTAELRISPWLNRIFEKLLDAEIVMIQKGINLPVGGSRLIVARKI
ncbi:class I SAM-dependent methyltransferase [Collimonas sp.]|jgi:SAM-dependent methyltransferase|uniref:class I SAM-dependent methyltransferase n=1 Tax=Collimonas sp. TaxID=1963772 RepID=UPI002C95BB4F|nr:class I SAM-dependent methyltransferase [Collimonas sp.]HWW04943.1 class I SAM-dependent methyltransferase [Collimonas sp.]